MPKFALRLEADRIYDNPLEARSSHVGQMVEVAVTRPGAANSKNRKGNTIGRRRRTA